MDSITHLAAGALTPFIFKRTPRTSAVVLLGIVAGELPDIDILAGVSAQAMLVMHRGMTHSIPGILILVTLLTCIFRLLQKKLFDQRNMAVQVCEETGTASFNEESSWSFMRAWLVVFIAIVIHVYLDCMTTFGTQVLWPLSDFRVAIPAMFIVDPLFTLPLLAVMVYCLRNLKRKDKFMVVQSWARRAFIFIIFYPLLCLGINTAVSWKMNSTLPDTEQGIEEVTLTPASLSPIFWKAVGASSSEYRLARASLLSFVTGEKPAWGRRYKRVDQIEWNNLQRVLPIFDSYASFVSFPVVHEKYISQGGRELTFEDLRYAPIGPEDPMHWFGRGDGMFLMQVRINRHDFLTGWRYLSKAADSSVTPWTLMESPAKLSN